MCLALTGLTTVLIATTVATARYLGTWFLSY